MEANKTREVNLKCGVTVHIDPDCLNDFELVEAITEAMDEDVRGAVHIIQKILSKEDKKALFNAIRENGTVPNEKVTEAIVEIFSKLAEKSETTKN